jgi:hypothetical protein
MRCNTRSDIELGGKSLKEVTNLLEETIVEVSSEDGAKGFLGELRRVDEVESAGGVIEHGGGRVEHD